MAPPGSHPGPAPDQQGRPRPTPENGAGARPRPASVVARGSGCGVGRGSSPMPRRAPGSARWTHAHDQHVPPLGRRRQAGRRLRRRRRTLGARPRPGAGRLRPAGAHRRRRRRPLPGRLAAAPRRRARSAPRSTTSSAAPRPAGRASCGSRSSWSPASSRSASSARSARSASRPRSPCWPCGGSVTTDPASDGPGRPSGASARRPRCAADRRVRSPRPPTGSGHVVGSAHPLHAGRRRLADPGPRGPERGLEPGPARGRPARRAWSCRRRGARRPPTGPPGRRCRPHPSPYAPADPVRPDPEELARAAFLAEPDPVGLYTEPAAAPVPVVRRGTTLAARRLRLVTVLALGPDLARSRDRRRARRGGRLRGLRRRPACWSSRSGWSPPPAGDGPAGCCPPASLLAVAAVVASGLPGPTIAGPAAGGHGLFDHPVAYTSAAAFPVAGDRLDVGDLQVDLTGLALTADATYHAQVDTGRVVVRTPPGTGVVLHYAVDTGDVQAYGTHVASGSDLTADRRARAAGRRASTR